MLNMLTHRGREYKSPLLAPLSEYLDAVFEHSLVTEAIFDGDRIINSNCHLSPLSDVSGFF
jgi:hypothetical protein